MGALGKIPTMDAVSSSSGHVCKLFNASKHIWGGGEFPFQLLQNQDFYQLL